MTTLPGSLLCFLPPCSGDIFVQNVSLSSFLYLLVLNMPFYLFTTEAPISDLTATTVSSYADIKMILANFSVSPYNSAVRTTVAHHCRVSLRAGFSPCTDTGTNGPSVVQKHSN